MNEDIEQPRRSVKQAQPTGKAPAPALDARHDSGGRLAIGLMIGITTIVALLTLAIVISIP